MWKYLHPDFASYMLGELQKQQQGSIFCDTLLQTDGVCVPAHSCVLAALSPIFSTSPAPPAGQNRLISLKAVGSQALLKLVGFLYTGQMEVESQSEHEEVMAAAHRLGLRNHIEKKRVWVERRVEDIGRSWRGTGEQIEDSKKENESMPVPLEKQSNTYDIAINSDALVPPVQPCGLLEPDLPPTLSFDEASPTRGFKCISDATVSPRTDMADASVSNHHKTKGKKRWEMPKRGSQLNIQTWQQNQNKLLKAEGTKLNPVGSVERHRNVSGKDFQKLWKSQDKKEAKLDRLKLKIKLKRRKGTRWESNLLVSVQGESEPDELKECAPRTPLKNCPSGLLIGQSLGTLTPPTDLPISPSDYSTHASSDNPCRHTPNHINVSSPLDVPTLSSSPPQEDESDEQIAMLLEDMFMMGLNILPLMPFDRNLDEHQLNQLGTLQDVKGGENGTESSAKGASLVQSCEPEMRESEMRKTATPGQTNEEMDLSGYQNQSGSSTVHAHSPGQELHASTSMATVARDSAPSLVEDLFLTSNATIVPVRPFPSVGEMSGLIMTAIPDDRLDFKLQKCLSPLESEKADSDVPSQVPSRPSQDEVSETHDQYPETQTVSQWLSASSLKLDFRLKSVIDSAHSHPLFDLSGSQNQSCLDLAENQELKTSNHGLITGSGLNLVQADVRDATEHPKQRMTRQRSLAAQRPKGKGDTNNQTQSQVQLRVSRTKCDDIFEETLSGNVNLSTSNSCGVGTQKTTTCANRNRTVACVKRRQENGLPLINKKPLLDNITEQNKHENDLPKAQFTIGTIKRRHGRPPKSKKLTAALQLKSINAKKSGGPPNSFSMATYSGQNDCDVEKTKTGSEFEQDNKQEPNQEIESTVMGEADVNNNITQTKDNADFKYASHAKGPSILNQIFHQACPRVKSSVCGSSLLISQQLTSSLQETAFTPQRFQELLEKSEEKSSKLVVDSEQNNEGICGVEESGNHERLQMSQVEHSVKGGEGFANEENSGLAANLFQNCHEKSCDLQKEIGKDIQDQSSEISVHALSSEDKKKDIMMKVDDLGHTMSPSKTNCVVIANKPTVLEETDMKNTVQKMHNKEFQSLRSGNWGVGCLENEEREDIGKCKVVQTTEVTLEDEETEVHRASDKVIEENTLLSSDGGCCETTNGGDDDEIDVEEDQNSVEVVNGRTPLEEESRIADDLSNTVLTQRDTRVICRDDPYVQIDEVTNRSYSHSPNVYSEDVSVVLSTVVYSSSEDDCHSEEEIDVDVLGDSTEALPWHLTATQIISLPVDGLQDQENEMEGTEEEEVDVTGEETE
ncbi:uncharacterized protein LOC127651825 [Xyrauchen texanus]|uniref:uncharacterized protein LOC127651825 n=1 Tax=Xyrauchen texanus TaxID=154827 RepID=UPI0022421DA9|nr:uncharacterized protein LOC127651825 [Xyrauchen texanus]